MDWMLLVYIISHSLHSHCNYVQCISERKDLLLDKRGVNIDAFILMLIMLHKNLFGVSCTSTIGSLSTVGSLFNKVISSQWLGRKTELGLLVLL